MPCSPAQVPSMAMARRTGAGVKSSASWMSASEFGVADHAQVEIAVADGPTMGTMRFEAR